MVTLFRRATRPCVTRLVSLLSVDLPHLLRGLAMRCLLTGSRGITPWQEFLQSKNSSCYY